MYNIYHLFVFRPVKFHLSFLLPQLSATYCIFLWLGNSKKLFRCSWKNVCGSRMFFLHLPQKKNLYDMYFFRFRSIHNIKHLYIYNIYYIVFHCISSWKSSGWFSRQIHDTTSFNMFPGHKLMLARETTSINLFVVYTYLTYHQPFAILGLPL